VDRPVTVHEFNSRYPGHESQHGDDVQVWSEEGEWFWSSRFDDLRRGPFETEALAVSAAIEIGPTLWPDRTLLGRVRWWLSVRASKRKLRACTLKHAEEARIKRAGAELLAKRRIAMHIDEAGGDSPRDYR